MLPDAMQVCSHGMSLAQAGWVQEGVGNPAGAAHAYVQAVQTLNAARAQAGGLPDWASYCLGCCQVRLGWLSHLGGNPTWAEGWLRRALPDLEAAWRACPWNPAYRQMLAHTAMALGRADLAEAAARPAAGAAVPPGYRGDAPAGQADGWLKLLKQGVSAARGCKELLDALGKLTGGAQGPGWGQGLEAGGGAAWGGWQGMDAGAPGWWG